MPSGLVRFQECRGFHFITFSCHRRQPKLDCARSRECFEQELERVRQSYDFAMAGYVVMPEHIHLLMNEPKHGKIATTLQILKQRTSRRLKTEIDDSFWQRRYYDFNVWSEGKLIEKLRYIHRNPVRRGLVKSPEDWPWSSFRHYATGATGIVEIESARTVRQRESGRSLELSSD